MVNSCTLCIVAQPSACMHCRRENVVLLLFRPMSRVPDRLATAANPLWVSLVASHVLTSWISPRIRRRSSVCFIEGHGDRDLSILQNKEIALHGYEISFRERESPDLARSSLYSSCEHKHHIQASWMSITCERLTWAEYQARLSYLNW